MHFREVLKNTHIDIRPFHYPEDHGGMRPKEFGAKNDFLQPNTANLPNLAPILNFRFKLRKKYSYDDNKVLK